MTQRPRFRLPPDTAAKFDAISPDLTLHRNRKGQPITMSRWVELMEDWSYRRVANTLIGPTRISTVFIGIDTPMNNGPLETMLFSPHEVLDLRRWTWRNVHDARLGHHQIARLVKDYQRQPLPLAKPLKRNHWR